MPLHWLDVTGLHFNTLLLLEAAQLSWMPEARLPERDMGIALRANPCVEWYLRHKCPAIAPWVEQVVMAIEGPEASPEEVRAAEVTVMEAINDWIVYAVDPAVYDARPFLAWDDRELTSLIDFAGKTVIDVGSGTGRLAFVAAAGGASAVFAAEPVGNLRAYIARKARARGTLPVYPLDGLITALPFPNGFADVTMGGHVLGDNPLEEHREMLRVTKPGGLVIHCPGNNDRDNAIHDILVAEGYKWSRFEEPSDGWKRKYWLRKAAGTL